MVPPRFVPDVSHSLELTDLRCRYVGPSYGAAGFVARLRLGGVFLTFLIAARISESRRQELAERGQLPSGGLSLKSPGMNCIRLGALWSAGWVGQRRFFFRRGYGHAIAFDHCFLSAPERSGMMLHWR